MNLQFLFLFIGGFFTIIMAIDSTRLHSIPRVHAYEKNTIILNEKNEFGVFSTTNRCIVILRRRGQDKKGVLMYFTTQLISGQIEKCLNQWNLTVSVEQIKNYKIIRGHKYQLSDSGRISNDIFTVLQMLADGSMMS